MFLNDVTDNNDQVSLRGTVIIIANHGERIDIPTGGIMMAMLVMVMMMVSMMMTVMVMARIIAESIKNAVWMKLNSHVKVLCWRTRLCLAI